MVFIKNQPERKTVRSDATHVVASISFVGDQPNPLVIYGRWITESGAPEHVGASSGDHEIDIPANAMPERPYIAVEPAGATSAFAYAQENLQASEDGSHQPYALPGLQYLVRIDLNCSQRDTQTLWNRRRTDGPAEEPLSIVPVPAPSHTT